MLLRKKLASTRDPELESKSTRLSELMVEYQTRLAGLSHMDAKQTAIESARIDELGQEITELRTEVNRRTEALLAGLYPESGFGF